MKIAILISGLYKYLLLLLLLLKITVRNMSKVKLIPSSVSSSSVVVQLLGISMHFKYTLPWGHT